MDSPNLDRALRFKSNARRGGVIENVFMRDVFIGRVSEAVLTIDFLYDTGASGSYKPVLRNVSLERVHSISSPRVMWVVGFPGVMIEDVRFRDCIFRGVDSAEVMNHAGSVSFRNVMIEPVNKSRSINSPQSAP
jgi:unsaturated rhamnogalacturonyl hydrolase